MNSRLLELAMRRGVLKARLDEQRRTLAQHAAPLAAALAKGDGVLKGVDWLKHHPAAVGAAVALAAVLRPRRAWRWAQRGLFLWQGWRAIKNSLSRAH